MRVESEMGRVYAFVVICERVLNEVDGIVSAIRIADVFTLQALPAIPVEQQAVPVGAVISVRLLEHDDLDHWAQVKLIRPSGEESVIGETPKAKIEQKLAGAPGGFNFVVQLGVIPKELGLHSIAVLFDGEELARGFFTLLRQEAAKEPPATVPAE